VDILAIQHLARPLLSTYIRGKKRIDYILVSASLQESVLWSDILPYSTVFNGHHHTCFIDFNYLPLFGDTTHPLAPSCQRSLQLSDPRKVSKYNEILHEQLEYHKISDRCSSLMEATKNNQWSPNHTNSYERLYIETLITESMLYAERSCSKKYTKYFEWSPGLIQAVETVRFWHLLLKRSKGLPISYTMIQ
jgi:hypothetical protein